MMYFSRLKTTVVLAICLLGILFGVPNLFPAPAAWMPWRTVHLGLDLRGGSYLLMQVDMNAVVKERLDGLTDGIRQKLRDGRIFYQTLEAQPAQDRVLLKLRDPKQTTEAADSMKSLISPDSAT
jgi:preprotein translocase subunit SecD